MTPDTTTEALRKAAADLLAAEGPEALTVRRIAARAGCSTMGLYSRFGGKDGVIEQLWVDGFTRLRDSSRAVVGSDDPVADLDRIAENYRAWALANATSYGVMFTRAVPDYVPSPEAKLVSIEALGVIVETVERAKALGYFAGLDAVDVAHMLWATSHGMVSLELAEMGPNPERRAEKYALATGTLLAALASRS